MEVSEKGLKKRVERGQELGRLRDDNSLTCIWQPNGYAHVQLPETPLVNAIILRQFPDKYHHEMNGSGLVNGLHRSMPKPDESGQSRLFQVFPDCLSLLSLLQNRSSCFLLSLAVAAERRGDACSEICPVQPLQMHCNRMC